jgi:hypothetical protein
MAHAMLIVVAVLIASMFWRRSLRHPSRLTLHHRLLVSGTVHPAHEFEGRYRQR